jgi:flagellin
MGTVTMANSDGTASASLSGAASQTGSFNVAFDGTDTFTLTKPDTTVETVQIDFGASGQLVFDGAVNFQNAGVSVMFSNMDVTDATVSVDFDVTGGGSLSFQVGTLASDTIGVSIASVTTAALGIGANTVDSAGNATTASNNLDTAIASVNAARADIGALMSRFEFVSANIATLVENLDAARSTLMDVDMAAEMSKFSSSQVLMQASVAMLAQANQMPQNLLRLLQ